MIPLLTSHGEVMYAFGFMMTFCFLLAVDPDAMRVPVMVFFAALVWPFTVFILFISFLIQAMGIY